MRYDPKRHHRRSIRLKGYDYSQAGAYFITIVTQDRACLFGNVANGEMQLNEAGQVVLSEWNGLPERFTSVVVDAFVVMPNHIHGIIIISSGEETIVDGAGLVPAPSAATTAGATTAGATTAGATTAGATTRVAPTDDVAGATVGAGLVPAPSAATTAGATTAGATTAGATTAGATTRVAPTDDVAGATVGAGLVPAPSAATTAGATTAGATTAGATTAGATTRVAPTVGDVIGAFKSRVTVEYTHGVKTKGWPPFRGRLWQRNYYEHIVRDEESLDQIRQYIFDNPRRWAFDQENPAATISEPGSDAAQVQ